MSACRIWTRIANVFVCVCVIHSRNENKIEAHTLNRFESPVCVVVVIFIVVVVCTFCLYVVFFCLCPLFDSFTTGNDNIRLKIDSFQLKCAEAARTSNSKASLNRLKLHIHLYTFTAGGSLCLWFTCIPFCMVMWTRRSCHFMHTHFSLIPLVHKPNHFFFLHTQRSIYTLSDHFPSSKQFKAPFYSDVFFLYFPIVQQQN